MDESKFCVGIWRLEIDRRKEKRDQVNKGTNVVRNTAHWYAIEWKVYLGECSDKQIWRE